jgi:low affinity Fe/Cu permease
MGILEAESGPVRIRCRRQQMLSVVEEHDLNFRLDTARGWRPSARRVVKSLGAVFQVRDLASRACVESGLSIRAVRGNSGGSFSLGVAMFDRLARWTAHAAGSRWATLAAFVLILGWVATGPLFGWSDSWQIVINTATTIVTFLMVFLIQASANRESAALHAKLDELIRAIPEAHNEVRGLETRTEAEIEAAKSFCADDVRPEGNSDPINLISR